MEALHLRKAVALGGVAGWLDFITDSGQLGLVSFGARGLVGWALPGATLKDHRMLESVV